MNNKTKILIFLSVLTLLIILLQIGLAVYRNDVFSEFEWYGRAIITLFITITLNYAAKSYARITGTYLSYNFQVGGAIVIFVIVFTSSYFKELFLSDKEFSFAVQVSNYNDLVMPKKMELYFLSGTRRGSATINDDGVANFYHVDDKLKKTNVHLQLKGGGGYIINSTSSTILIDQDKNLGIQLEKDDYIEGEILNNMKPVDHASIRIDDLDTTIYSNQGIFRFKVPELKKKNSYQLNITWGSLNMLRNISLNSFSQFEFQD